MELEEALELVMQEGSDDEVDLGYDDEEGEDEDNEFSPVQVGDLEVEEDTDLDRSTSAAVDTQLEPGSEMPEDLDLPPDDSSDDDVVPPTPPQQSTSTSRSRSSPGPSTSRQSPDLFDDQEPEPVDVERDEPDPADQPDDDDDPDADVDLDPADLNTDHLLFDEPLEWVRDLDNYPVSPPFTGQSGFQINIPTTATALWFNKLFMTNTLIKKMKTETNRYAAAACRQAIRRNPNLSRRSFF